MKTLPVTVASESAVTATVHTQQPAIVKAYLRNWRAAEAWVAAKTQDRLSQKCSVTARMYATATAANRGMRWTKNQIRLKSTRATRPPTVQNRKRFFASISVTAVIASASEKKQEFSQRMTIDQFIKPCAIAKRQ